MANLSRVLMLVACVPLLQPTGFCVCKAGEWQRASPHQEPIAVSSHVQVAAQKTGCCSQRCTTDEATETATTPTEPVPHPCPSPGDDDHMPGCPASVGVDRFKWVEPAQSIAQTLPPLDVGTFLPLEVVQPVTVRPIPPAANLPLSLPIYLSHCALVI